MDIAELSRRSLLRSIAAVVATAATPIGWVQAVAAMEQAHTSSSLDGSDATISFLTAAEALDVGAVAAQIVPTDDLPGAHEAGAVYFIDRALATFFSQLAGDYRAQLASFQSSYRERYPAAPSFASLKPEQQIEHLRSIDETPFFDTTRLLTLLGMFSLPKYGGNRSSIGWKLIGFEDRHVFHPPFGYYDRDYPGFYPVDAK
jgi:gluconate 2-dehydrogenase gamma chain